jgi:hypothetical protein
VHHSQPEGSIELTESAMSLSLLLLLRLRLSPRCTQAGPSWRELVHGHRLPLVTHPSPTSQPGGIFRSAHLHSMMQGQPARDSW